MSQIKLGSKWGAQEDMGAIHRFMQRRVGESTLGQKNGDDIMNKNKVVTADEMDLEEIMQEHASESEPVPEEIIDQQSAAIEIMSRMGYSSANTIDRTFNAMADILKLPLDARKIDRDSKIMWVSDNILKLSPSDTITIYKVVSS